LNPVADLALKVVLTPALIGTASLAGRRWGSSVGGWLIGMPFTSGPIVFFLALGPGPRFAALTAEATMTGAISQAAFCLAYSWSALRSGWVMSLLAATTAYAVATVVLIQVPLRGLLMFVLIIVVLVISLLLMPLRGVPTSTRMTFPAWDLPARMVLATVLVVVLTSAAPLLGPRLAGLLAPYPIYGAVLAGFAHHLQGAASATAVLRGLLLGLFAFAAFFLLLSGFLPYGIAFAFSLAIAAALVVQGASLLVGRRLAIA
jgi:hypothetical protein